MHPTYRKLATDITKQMGLRFCGVDILTRGDITKPCRDYVVIEINASPGLDRYAAHSAKTRKRVEDIYYRLLVILST
jgi:glutathione synthase/RimK-type ligase-like ATP-grasp enzyme